MGCGVPASGRRGFGAQPRLNDAPLSGNTLIYILQHDSREAAQPSWDAFPNDPEWRAAFEELNRDGRLAASVESVYMEATDFSPLQQRATRPRKEIVR